MPTVRSAHPVRPFSCLRPSFFSRKDGDRAPFGRTAAARALAVGMFVLLAFPGRALHWEEWPVELPDAPRTVACESSALAALEGPSVASLQTPAFQIVYDVEDPCFEFLGGAWSLFNGTGRLGSFGYEIAGPGAGEARGRWIVEGLPAGTYTVEFWARNDAYPSDARYQVIHSAGVANLQINMNFIPAGWNELGTFDLNGVCVVNVNDFWEGAGTKMYVDALRFTLTSALPPPPATAVPPHIGICIDDSGAVNPTQSGTPIYRMLRLPFPMTHAVLPYRDYTVQTANEAHAMGSEVILHQPMAAITVPNPGTGGITDAMTLEQVRSTVATNLDAMPHVLGMNNHMGSLITQQVDKMTVCMEELEKRGLYWFDSRTITTSVAYDVAMAHGILTAERDLFIDDTSVEGVKTRIRSLALRALHAPEIPHLAIGHVRADTATGLEEMAPELAALGVEVWPISRCIHHVVEVGHTPAGASIDTVGAWRTATTEAHSKMTHEGDTLALDDPAATRDDSIAFTPSLQTVGLYDVFALWPDAPPNSPDIRATLQTALGPQTTALDQTVRAGRWVHLGRHLLHAGTAATTTFDSADATEPDTVFRAKAVRYQRVDPEFLTGVQGWCLY